jgi:hypothetical protein
MKLPFDLGVKLFFRLLLPGFFLTLGVLPLLFTLLDNIGLHSMQETAFVIALIISGWIVVAADMPIYMLLEGRRYWPQWLRGRMMTREEKRLTRISAEIDRYYEQKRQGVAIDRDVERRYLEASVEVRSFPLDDQGDRSTPFPTRLGNAITAFETYAKSRYGLEAIFYWPRIWVNLDKDLREEIDNQQALADSAVYCSFVLLIVCALWIAYSAFGLLEPLLEWSFVRLKIPGVPWGAGIVRYLPHPAISLVIAIIASLLSHGVYRLSVFANEQFGVVFMAVIDSHAAKVATNYVGVDAIAKKVGRLTKSYVPDEEKLEVARRYLQYFNARVRGRDRAVPIPQMSKELTAQQPPVVTSSAPEVRV